MKKLYILFIIGLCLPFLAISQTLTLTTQATPTKNQSQGANVDPIYILKIVNSSATAANLGNIRIRVTEGTYDANDIPKFKIGIGAGSTVNFITTSSLYDNSSGAGENNLLTGANFSIPGMSTRYIFFIPNYASDGNDGHTVKFNGANNPIEIVNPALTIVNNQSDLSGTHTIKAPTFTLSTEATLASNVSPGDSPNIYILKLVVGSIPIVVNGFKFTPTGSFTSTEINTFVVGSSSTSDDFFSTLGGYTGSANPLSGNLYTVQVPANSIGTTYNANQTVYFAIKPNFKTTATTNKTIKINGLINPVELITTATPNVTQNQSDNAGEVTLKVPSVRVTTVPAALKRALSQSFNDVYKLKIENIGELPYTTYGVNFNVGGDFTESEFPKSSINCIVTNSSGAQLKNALNVSTTPGLLSYLLSNFGANPVTIPVGDYIFITINANAGTLFNGATIGKIIKINGASSGFVSQTIGNFGTIENNQADVAGGLIFDGNLAGGTASGSISNIGTTPKYALSGEQIVTKVSSPTTITGSTSCLIWDTGGQTKGYVPRHYEINPPTASSGASATVTLYFTQPEFNNFNTNDINEVLIPTGPADTQGIANLRVMKFAGPSTAGSSGLTYASITPTIINPDDNKIVWNALASRWEITFDITGFSGFFVGAAATPLPVSLISFSGKNQENQIQLTWKTTNETNFSHFEIQKSENGQEFGTIGNVNSNESGFYNFIDTDVSSPIGGGGGYYYKLKMIDLDGTSTFSKTISVNFEKNGYYLSVENPAKNGEFLVRSNYVKPSFILLNSLGQKMNISVAESAENQHKIKAKIINNGIYFLTIESEGKVFIRKVLME